VINIQYEMHIIEIQISMEYNSAIKRPSPATFSDDMTPPLQNWHYFIPGKGQFVHCVESAFIADFLSLQNQYVTN